jgi:hypothetical protein
MIDAHGKSLQLEREFQRAAHGGIVVNDRNNGRFCHPLGAVCHRQIQTNSARLIVHCDDKNAERRAGRIDLPQFGFARLFSGGR